MIDVEEADRILREPVVTFGAELCRLDEAEGRILREDIRADRDQPPYDRVAMDGIAVATAGVSSGARLEIEATQGAGDRPVELMSPEGCIEVMTGCALPVGCDAVVRLEDLERDGGVAVLAGERRPEFMANVHRRGSDCAAGAVLVRAGPRLTAPQIAVAAAMGRTSLLVARRPRIAVVATGNEVVDVASEPAGYQVRRSNGHAIGAALRSAGLGRATLFHLGDDPVLLGRELERLLGEFDVLALTGGVSKGRFDHVPDVLAALGVQPRIRGIRQRPGKPMWFGARDETPVFALPGNPVPALMCLYRYVLPYLVRASGGGWKPRRLRLGAPARGLPGLTHFLPVRLSHDTRGLCVLPAYTNGSGDFMSLAETDGFMELPASSSEAAADTLVPVFPWRAV